MDILDICIQANLFPLIDVWACPICNEDLGILDEEVTSNWIDHLVIKHNVKDAKIFNIYPFLLYGTPDFDFACFDEGHTTLQEYHADWIMNEKCFLTACKSHFGNEEKLAHHESVHQKHIDRMKIQLAPFWKFIKVNAPDSFDHKFFDFLDINKNFRLHSTIFKCVNTTNNIRCNYISATKMGHCHRGEFVNGNLAV
jgi:hypothetical protein